MKCQFSLNQICLFETGKESLLCWTGWGHQINGLKQKGIENAYWCMHFAVAGKLAR